MVYESDPKFSVGYDGIYKNVDYPSNGMFQVCELVMDKETFIEAFKEYILPDLDDILQSRGIIGGDE